MLYLAIVLFIVLVFIFIKYEPKFDLVFSKDKQILFLWYNKIEGKYIFRKYIRLIEL